jgi:DnaD/phage-associated family protein
MGVRLTHQSGHPMTQISNIFIDKYMPHANGSFVKVYLFLLRHLHNPSSVLTIESMADMLFNTEADILRALRYWESQGLLSITESDDGEILSLCLLSPNLCDSSRMNSQDAQPAPSQTQTVHEEFSASQTLPVPSEEAEAELPESEAADDMPPLTDNIVPILPKRQTYSPLQAEALKKDAEIEACLSMVEALLGTTMGDSHMQLILYLMSDLGFSSDLVITLYETAISRGKRKPRYLEAIALDWAKKGIRTPKEAKAEVSSFSGMYKIVSTAFGIKRTLAPAEMRIIDKWEAFHFPKEVIEEACSRTILQAGDVNLNYTTKILTDWHEKGVTTIKDVEECDKSFFRQKAHTQNAAKNNSLPKPKNRFQNFPQRNYSQAESNDLERQLLQQ